MTEDEWAAAEEDAIWAAISPLSMRRQRLLAVALVRSLGRWAEGEVVAGAMDACERFADTGKTKAALKRARVALSDSRVLLANLANGPQDRTTLGKYMTLFVAGVACSEEGPGGAVRETVLTWREAEGVTKAEARRRVYPVFCEVAGPAPPVAFDPSWRTDTAVLLARGMYESLDFSAMPILADAL